MPDSDQPESVREGLALLDYHFFPQGDDDRYLRGDSFQENVIRLIVFDMHLAIEELLRSLVFDSLSRHSAQRQETAAYVKGLASRQALDLAVQLGVIDAPRYEQLRELNALRNRAAHHWDLDGPILHRSGDASPALPLSWRGRRLTPHVVKHQFLAVYGDIYRALFSAWRGAHPQRVDASSDASA
jgi:hypothetical protein